MCDCGYRTNACIFFIHTYHAPMAISTYSIMLRPTFVEPLSVDRTILKKACVRLCVRCGMTCAFISSPCTNRYMEKTQTTEYYRYTECQHILSTARSNTGSFARCISAHAPGCVASVRYSIRPALITLSTGLSMVLIYVPCAFGAR
jgi:hypothetical protein